MKLRTLTLYCGSASGTKPAYSQAAQELGEILANRKINLVYGGGKVGLMGVAADAVMSNGGHVTGIIPEFLMKWEVGHEGVNSLEIVRDMHERKMRMASLADAFITLPGGWGTMEELMEMLTWNQIHLHNKPIGILNVDGYYDPLISFFNMMENEGFLKKGSTHHIYIHHQPDVLIDMLEKAVLR